jgi:uncharacterized spore protein YtfJ
MEAKDLMQQVGERIERAANVKAVFGDPVNQGSDTVIPVARVSVRGGAGASAEATESEGKAPKGKGMGVGLNVVSSPVGYIRSSSEGPTYVSIVDRNRLIMAGAVLAGIGLLAIRTGLKAFGKQG